MIAIDTNIIVRLLTKDDEEQYQKAYRIFSSAEDIFIPTTVALHLVGSLQADKFASFDKKLRNKANTLKTGIALVEP